MARAKHTLETIEEVCGFAQMIVDRISQLTAAMKANDETGPLNIQFQRELERAMEFMEKWVNDAHIALGKTLRDKGKFGKSVGEDSRDEDPAAKKSRRKTT